MIHNHEVPSSILGPATSKSLERQLSRLFFCATKTARLPAKTTRLRHKDSTRHIKDSARHIAVSTKTLTVTHIRRSRPLRRYNRHAIHATVRRPCAQPRAQPRTPIMRAVTRGRHPAQSKEALCSRQSVSLRLSKRHFSPQKGTLVTSRKSSLTPSIAPRQAPQTSIMRRARHKPRQYKSTNKQEKPFFSPFNMLCHRFLLPLQCFSHACPATTTALCMPLRSLSRQAGRHTRASRQKNEQQ